jgi:hypothetical protein
MKHFALLLIATSLIGCTSTKTDVRNEAEAARYNPATTARLRIVTGEGNDGSFVSGKMCEQLFDAPRINPWVSMVTGKTTPQTSTPAQAPREVFFALRPFNHQNMIIGMPPSTTTRTIDSTRLVYDEHVVPAGQPLIVRMEHSDTAVRCNPPPRIFMPEAGQDYEAQYRIAANKCSIEVQLLESSNDNVQETPLLAGVCSYGPNGAYRTITPADLAKQAGQDAAAN